MLAIPSSKCNPIIYIYIYILKQELCQEQELALPLCKPNARTKSPTTTKLTSKIT